MEFIVFKAYDCGYKHKSAQTLCVVINEFDEWQFFSKRLNKTY